MESDVREPWVNWNKEIENTSKRNENEEQSFDEEWVREKQQKKEKPKTIPGTLRNEEEQTVLSISVTYSCMSNHIDDNSTLYNIVL